MTFVVTDACIKCKYTDCVEVCPVDCFYEGENMLIINPDECIDCGVCEPECPAEAIHPESDSLLKWVELARAQTGNWPNLTVKKPSPDDADAHKGEAGKFEKYFSDKPGNRQSVSARSGDTPDFTAFIVTLILAGVHRHAKWRVLVPEPSAALYEACVKACVRKSLLMRVLSLLPDALKLRAFDAVTAFGYNLHLALRKQAIEVQARSDIKRGVAQLVVIGAGFDALSLRLSREFPEVRFYELDVPGTQNLKRSVMSDITANLYLLPCDLARSCLREVMEAAPAFERDVPTLYIAEGLTMYLTEAENRAWLHDVRYLSGDEARLLLTAMETLEGRSTLGKAVRDQFLRRHNAAFQWAIGREEMPEFLEQSGFVLKFGRYFSDMQASYRSAKERVRISPHAGDHVYYAAAKMQHFGRSAAEGIPQ